MALAELARRGLLLTHRLTDVIPLVTRALLYDVKKGDDATENLILTYSLRELNCLLRIT